MDFASLPDAPDAIRLRRWNDLAKVAEQTTPPLDHFLEIAESLSTRIKPTAVW